MSTHSSRSLIAIFFLFLSVHPLQAQVAYEPFLAETLEDAVNVRAGQSVSFERICQLDKGEEVVVLDKQFSWYKVQLPSKAKVYISDKYVAKRRSDQGQVSAASVNLRAGPDITYSVVGKASEGQLVVIKEHKNGWYAIEPLPDNFGWVSEELLKFKSAQLPPIKPAEFVKAETPEPSAPEPTLAALSAEAIKKADPSGEHKVISGALIAQKDPAIEGVQYKIVDGGQTYYIKGQSFSLEYFLGFNVRAEGIIEESSYKDSGIPLLKLSKVQLIL